MSALHNPNLRIIHWLTANLVLLQLLLTAARRIFPDPLPKVDEALVQAHITIGATIFCITFVRLVIRVTSVQLTDSRDTFREFATFIVHVMLYTCLLVVPISGCLKLAALGTRIHLWGAVQLPEMSLNIVLYNTMSAVHLWTSVTLIAFLTIHIAGATFHKVVSNFSDR
ncbi:MAG: cytochrome b/b6 domain-containing protein [Pseudoruegeria sp.]